MKKTYYRGDVYMADLGQSVGSEQGGSRPVVIVQNDTGNHFSPTVIVAAVTSKTDSKAKLPTHFSLESITKLPSLVLCEQVRTLDKQRLGERLGRLTQKELQQLDYALSVSFGLRKPHKKKKEKVRKSSLIMTLCPSCANAFCWDGEHILKRMDPTSTEMDLCTFCGQRYGHEYNVIKRVGSGRCQR
jgi:mRNA interferase MazF